MLNTARSKCAYRVRRKGIRLDVRRAYLDYRRADRDLQDARKSRRLARQWLREARDDFEFDPQTIGDLIAAFETWALPRTRLWRSPVRLQPQRRPSRKGRGRSLN